MLRTALVPGAAEGTRVAPPPTADDDQLRELLHRLESLEARVVRLEGERTRAGLALAASAAPVPAPSGFLHEQAAPYDPLRFITALGRSLIALGGAFLLRALTEQGV